MKDEFNLSDKEFFSQSMLKRVYFREDVKEFIKILKEIGIKHYYDMGDKKHYFTISIEDLDNLAGDKLK